MKKLFFLMLIPMSVMTLLCGCYKNGKDYKKKLEVNTAVVTEPAFFRYEDVLFNMDTANFQQELKAAQRDYGPFLEGDLDDPDAVKYLKDFAVDPFSIIIYNKVKETYPNLNDVRAIVNGVYQHFNYYYPEIVLPRKIYTCVSGVDPQSSSVMLLDDALVISLDWYLNGDEIYDRLGMPKYMSDRTLLPSLAKDLGVEIYKSYVQQWHKQSNLLEEMVCAGKMYFFAEAMCPSIADEVLLGYTKPQLKWAVDNEGNLWADLVGSQQLYSTEMEMFRTFFSDGPFTNEYSHEAPPRLGEFLGVQIVRSYMSNKNVSLQELMQNGDLQGIFLESGYKPKK